MAQIPLNQEQKLKIMNNQFNDYIELTKRRKTRLTKEGLLLEKRKQELEKLLSQQKNIISYQQEKQKEIAKLNNNIAENTNKQSNNNISLEEQQLLIQHNELENKYIEAVQNSNRIITKYNALVNYMELMENELQSNE